MERAVFVYTTWPSTVEAEQAGHALVERRLAACVNILPGMVSVYRWEGKVERAVEWYCHCKTTLARASGLRARLREVHPYETPEIIILPIVDGDPAYLRWIEASVTLDG